jgi:putative mRNA 3-end processing factor
MRIVHEVFGLQATGGLNIPSASLWLDGFPRQGIAFRSDLERLPRRLHRLLCSAPLAELLAKRVGHPLAMPYGTPFNLGPMTVELLQAGSGLGASLLRMQLNDRSVLYAAAAQPDCLPTSSPLAVAPADILVLDASLAGEPQSSCQDLRLSVEAHVQRTGSGGAGVVWLVERRAVAMDIAHMVGDRLPLYGAHALRDLARRYQHMEVAVPRIRTFRQKLPEMAHVLWPIDHVPTLARGAAASWPRLVVKERCDDLDVARFGAASGLAFSARASGHALDRLIDLYKPADVVAFGAGAADLCRRQAAGAARMWHLVDDVQLSLV